MNKYAVINLKLDPELKKRAANAGVGGQRDYNPGWHTSIDLANLLTVSEAIAKSALDRKESRGGHFRDDYPDKSAGGGTYNSIIKKGTDGQMVLERRPLQPLPDELKQIIEDQKK